MDLGLEGRVALVAASTRGIGRAIAYQLLQEGCSVVVNGRDESSVRRVVAEMSTPETEARVLGVAADVATDAGVRSLVTGAIERFGTIDILVTNTGGPKVGSFFDLSDEDFRFAYELIFLSVVRLVRETVPHMRRQKWGRILAVSSTAVREPVPMVTLTNSIRPSVVALAKDLSRELASDGITVNSILVGPVLTDRLRETVTARAASRSVSEESEWEEYLKLVPLGRWGLPEEVAASIVHLASERAGWVTGVVLPVDGGRIRSNW